MKDSNKDTNKKRFRKRSIFAAVAVLLAAGILILDLAKNFFIAEAKQNVFTQIMPYQTDGLKILEVTPTVNDKELGYFFPVDVDDALSPYVANVSHGTKFDSEISAIDDFYGDEDGTAQKKELADPNLAAVLRSYGMIKPEGPDSGVGSNSEYPIYDRERKGVFGSEGGIDDYVEMDIPVGDMVQGHYVFNENNTGSYKLMEGYCIGTGEENFDGDAVLDDGMPVFSLDTNYIYKKTLVLNEDFSVSENDFGQISGNTTEDREIYQYEKVTGDDIPEGIIYAGNSKDGNLDFKFIPDQDDIYYGYAVEKIIYLNNNRWYRAGNWIKEYILGDAQLECQVTYDHRTLDALTVDDIQNADLIYLSGTADEYKEADLDMNSELVKELYNQSAIYHKAVIMDSAIYSGGVKGFTNLDKLALLLWQDDQKLISTWDLCFSFFIERTGDNVGNAETEYLIDDIDALLRADDVFTSLQSTMVTGYNGTFAIHNVYVYNHHFSDFQNSKLEAFQNNALDNMANGDLNSYFTAAAAECGFQSVLDYIKLNNEKLTDDEISEGCVTPALVIQYILCYKGEDIALEKNAYTVLEIQPTREFKFNSGLESKNYTLETPEVKESRNAFIRDCLNEDIVKAGNQDLVTFDSVTVDAFNTMQTDLFTSYDVVYIGALHTTYYKHVTGTAVNIEPGNGFVYKKDASIPSYNDDGMDGNVYFNYGDAITNDRKESYSSRDLTEAKLIALKDYLQKNGLIIVDGDLMKSIEKGNTVVNPTRVSSAAATYYDHGRMDDSSNMYELFTFARGGSISGEDAAYYRNLVSESDLENKIVKKADMTSYLNRERISMLFINRPSEYFYTEINVGQKTIVTYLAEDKTDGKYYLDYEFVINNTASIADGSEFYEVRFYEDMNADGRFDDVEEKSDYSITLVSDGSEAPSSKDDEGGIHYSLKEGVAYKLRRPVPSHEGGIIDWCLKAEKVNNRNICCQETGYTAIKPKEKKYINILQIQPDTAVSSSAVNLETLQESDALYGYIHALPVEDQYEITVRSVTVSQFQEDAINYYIRHRADFESDEELWQEFFNSFERSESDDAGYSRNQIENDEDRPMAVNMLILGFGDSYTQFSAVYPINAVRNFIETNKPVLISNHVIGPDINEADINRTLNYKLLGCIGQDRYGYTDPLYNRWEGDINTNNFYAAVEQDAYDIYIGSREAENNAIAYVPGSGRGLAHLIPIGYTNTYRARMRTGLGTLSGKEAFINAKPVQNLYGSNDPTAAASGTYVDKMNEGQISHYPYTLKGSILLGKSQAQYFQLDLDSDSDLDGNSDIVVWYTLGDMANEQGTVLNDANIYSVTPGDGINNYYIYNKGNVTFTGFGARPASQITAGEAQLFVNTLIAAYETGIVNPVVSYCETSDSNASMLESMEFDMNTEEASDDAKAYFKIQDFNPVKGNKICKAEFYLGVEDNAGHRYIWPDGTASKIVNIQLTDHTIVSVVRIPMDIYNADFSEKEGVSEEGDAPGPDLYVGTVYGFYAPASYLSDMEEARIYIKADISCRVSEGSTEQYTDRLLGTAYDMFTMLKQDSPKQDQ